MQQPTMKKAVKTIFPDPMDKFKWQDVLWDFRSKEALEEWTLVTDEQFGGKSTAEFVQSPGGRAIFKGHISTELPPASDVKYTGMCSIRAQPKWVSYTPPPLPSCPDWGSVNTRVFYLILVVRQPRSQSSSAILDVTSPVKLVRKICTWFQASPGNSDSANWPGYEAGGGEQSVLSPRFEMDSRDF